MKLFTKKIIRFLLLFILAKIVVLIVSSLIAYPFNDIQGFASIKDKKSRLDSLKINKKIILFGGSNVAYNYDSKIIDEHFKEFEIINMGTQGSRGMFNYFETIKPYIGNGDVVIFEPVYEHFSHNIHGWGSLYFPLLVDLNSITQLNYIQLIGLFPNMGNLIRNNFSRLMYGLQGRTQNRRNFYNDYGDYNYESNKKVLINEDVDFHDFSINMASLEYLKEMNEIINNLGAKLIINFQPFPQRLYSQIRLPIERVVLILNDYKFRILSSPEDNLYDINFFHDSIGHIKSRNKIHRTKKLIISLEKFLK